MVSSAPVLTTVERDYDDTLPSLNLVADSADDFLVRFGAAKVMARPGLGNLTPGVTVSVSGGNRTVTGGNPLLDPFRATTADLGFEWYFAEESLLALGLFYKDIDTFVQTSRETRPYNTSGLPDSLLDGTGALPTDDFQFNIPVNTPGRPAQGLRVQLPAAVHLPAGLLERLRRAAELHLRRVGDPVRHLDRRASLQTDLTGLSKNAYNATLYYEGDRFGARVSCGLPRRLPDHGAGPQQQRRRRHQGHARRSTCRPRGGSTTTSSSRLKA